MVPSNTRLVFIQYDYVESTNLENEKKTFLDFLTFFYFIRIKVNIQQLDVYMIPILFATSNAS